MVDPEKFYSKLGKTFKPGVITTVVLKTSELARQGKKIFDEAPREAWEGMLQYGSTQGMYGLRREISKFMAGSGMEADPGEIIITAGSQEAIDLVTRVFLDRGDAIYIGRPTYLSALSAFKQVSPEFREIPIDEDGMEVDALEADLRKMKAEGRSVKLLYVIPCFQNPTSTVLSAERKKRVLELAEEHDFIIFEDNPYGYISFEGPMPTPLAAMDRSGRVMYMSTFSKIVSPGMRIGWIASNPEFTEKRSASATTASPSTRPPSSSRGASWTARYPWSPRSTGRRGT